MPSEGEHASLSKNINIASSEGEDSIITAQDNNYHSEDTRKHSLSDINISNILIHPSLYSTEKRFKSPSKSHSLSKQRQRQRNRKDQQDIDQLIKEFKYIPK